MGNLHGQGFGDLLCATAAEAPLDPGSSRPAPGGALCGLRLPRGIVLARHRLRVGWRSLLLLPRTLPIQRLVPMTKANFPLRTTQETQVFLTKNSSVLTCHSWEPLSPWALLGPVSIWGPDVLLWASRLTVIRVLSFCYHLLSFVISSHQHISGHPLENSGCPLDAIAVFRSTKAAVRSTKAVVRSTKAVARSTPYSGRPLDDSGSPLDGASGCPLNAHVRARAHARRCTHA